MTFFVCCVVLRKHQHIFYVATTQAEKMEIVLHFQIQDNNDQSRYNPYPSGYRVCGAIIEWCDTGDVQIGLYPIAFHSALISQAQIGWQHLFIGHWSTGWEELLDSMTTSKG